jgi:RND superfamily putative drug exporter
MSEQVSQAETFTVLALAGGSDQARQLGFTVSFAILLDTLFVRTLAVPSIAALLGRRNWWPSSLSRAPEVEGTSPDSTAAPTGDHSPPGGCAG